MRVLVTGASGFAGTHLLRLLSSKKELELYGTYRDAAKLAPLRRELPNVKFYACEFTDEKAVRKLILKVRPDRIFHLAGKSFVPDSIAHPKQTLIENIFGLVHLLEAVRAANIRPRILVAGSATVYGHSKTMQLPLTEKGDCSPSHPYALSKSALELIMGEYVRRHKMQLVCTRAFSHIGPGQDSRFSASHFAHDLAKIKAGKQKSVIPVGNLKSRRDISDVRDVVHAYWLALEKGKAGEIYNICSGKAFAVGTILDKLIAISGLKVKVQVDPKRLRPNEIPVLVGSPTKFARATGWKPLYSPDTTLRDLFQDWEQRIQSEKN